VVDAAAEVRVVFAVTVGIDAAAAPAATVDVFARVVVAVVVAATALMEGVVADFVSRRGLSSVDLSWLMLGCGEAALREEDHIRADEVKLSDSVCAEVMLELDMVFRKLFFNVLRAASTADIIVAVTPGVATEGSSVVIVSDVDKMASR
jgi:hypothetical protein